MSEDVKKWGGARAGAGRKTGSTADGEHKTGRIVISCFKSEEEKIKELAKQSGKSVSRFVLDNLIK